MQDVSFVIIVAYLSKYLLAFIVSMLGSFANTAMIAMKSKHKIRPLKILISSIFNAFLLCAVQDYFTVSFQVYMFICFFIGMWGYKIMEIVTSANIVAMFLKNVFKAFKDPISKAAAETMEGIEKKSKDEDSDDTK